MKKNSEFTVDHIIAAEQFIKEKKYWLDKLQGELVKTHFPYDFTLNHKDDLQIKRQQYDFGFTREIDAKLLSIANNADTRLLMLLTAGLVVLLHKYTGHQDIIIGSPILKQAVHGDFVNTLLILRHHLEENTTFKELLYTVKQTLVEASQNQNYPLQSLSRELGLDTVVPGEGNPFFDCVILLESLHDKSYIQESKLGMIFSFAVEQETLHGNIGYNAALYDEGTIKRIARHYEYLYRYILFNSELTLAEMPILSPEEKKQLLEEFNRNDPIPVDFSTIVAWFEHQVEKTPGHIAVDYENQTIDYQELNKEANRLARVLMEKGVRRETIVALLFNSSIEMIAAVLAVLKTGAAYLPIHPQLPETRIRYMLEDSLTNYLLTSPGLQQNSFFSNYCFGGNIVIVDEEKNRIYNDEKDSNTGMNFDAGALAYVIYTSGSTGMPKGVLIKHQGILNYINWRYHTYRLSEKDVTLQLLPYNFDGFNSNFYSSLLSGGTLLMIPEAKMLDFGYIMELIKTKGVTNTSIIPRVLDIILDYAREQDLKSMRFVVLAGEKAEKRLLEKIKQKNPGIILFNEYGPTEASVTITANQHLEPGFTSVIGKPIANTQIFILNGTCRIVPVGVPGELCAAGPGLAKGYLNNPELTLVKFVESPLKSGITMYRTGDLARWLMEGNIEFLGRLDHQLKIRGFRVELGEIERWLLNHPGVTACVVKDLENDSGDKYLCAYIVSPTNQNNPGVTELREYMASGLPDYMIPAYFVFLESLPLSASGKIDPRRLPEPDLSVSTEKYAAPRDPVEKQLVEIWANLLGSEAETIGIDSNFFELGGHSLTATILANQVHKELNVKIPMLEIFESPFIRNMAEYIKNSKKELFAAVRPTETQEYYPTSAAQNRLFIIHQLVPEAVAYNVTLFAELEGKLERESLEQSFRQLIRRHESLRTSFEMIEGNPVQRIHPPAEIDFKVKYDPLEGEDPGTAMARKTGTFIHSFDLSRAPLLRVELCKINSLKHILLVDMHHIITDGISLVILIDEFLAWYNGTELPPLQLQYKDFSTWQQSPGMKETLRKQEEYWLKQFESEIPALTMPMDYPRPKIQSFEGAGYFFAISREEAAGLNQVARSQGATLFMVLLGLFNLWLYKISSQDDIVVGTPIAGRRHAEVEKIIGIFVNMLALRNHVEGEKTFAGFLNDLKIKTLEAFENQDYQFADLVENLELERNVNRNPLFDVVFIFQNIYDRAEGIGEKELKGLKIKPVTGEHRSSQFDMTLQVTESQDNMLSCGIEYCTRLFREETITRFMGYFIKIISSVVENPDKKIADIEIISAEEKNRLLYEFNDTESLYPWDKTIHQIFEEQVEQTPDHTALVGSKLPITNNKRSDALPWVDGETISITYNELSQKSRQLACKLQEKGVGPDIIVGIMLENSLEMIIGIFGILKAGGAYLPIEPGYPEERKQYMLIDSGVKVLLSDKSHFNCQLSIVNYQLSKTLVSDRNDLGTGQCPVPMHSPATYNRPPATSLAYVIYTSGTMGRPKGSLIEHRNVVRLLFNDRSPFDFSGRDTWTLFHSYGFDFSVWEMYGALLKGGRLVLLPKQVTRDPERFWQVLVKEQVTVLNQTPAAFYQLEHLEMQHLGRELRLRTIVFGGDALNPFRLKSWQKKYPETKLINMYGITETTVHVTYKEISPREIQSTASNIGFPIPTLSVYILSPHQQLIPIGVAGEMYVGGRGVCRGYLNRPGLTSERFIKSPFRQRERLYRSGDLGRYHSSGDIEYLGRIDHQVKIRGYRIELEEITHQLLKHENIKEAVVIAREKPGGDKYLCAYIVSASLISLPGLRDFLSKRLPDYMVPAYFIFLDQIPMTANGKIDKKVLPAPEIKQDEGYVPPGNEMETKLVEVWAEVLGIEKNVIGIDANFFELGGHSLTATIMTAKIHKKLQVKLPLSEVFTTPTIRGLSRYLKGVAEEKYTRVEPVEKKEYYPLSSAQRRLYFLYLMEPQKTTYNLTTTLRLGKEIEKNKIEAALKKLIARHESLRTSFKEVNKVPVQQIHPLEKVEFEIEYAEVELPGTGNTAAHIVENFIRPFDLSRAPLIRSCLIKLPDGNHTWIVDIHHIVSDGTSNFILAGDFADLYTGKALPELNIQYKDFSEWHNRVFPGDRLTTRKDYWLNLYPHGEEIPRLELPMDFKRPKEFTFAGDSYHFSLEREDAIAFKALASRYGGTLYMNVLAVLNTLFYIYTGQTDIIIGAGVAGRPHDDLQGIVGMFVNTLAIRNYPRGNLTYEVLLKQVSANCIQAFENQDLQFEDLVDMLSLERDISRNPVFDIMMLVQNFQGPDRGDRLDAKNNPSEILLEPGLSSAIDYKHTTSRLDMTILVSETGSNLSINIEYYTGIFKRETMTRLARHFQRAIKEVVANPAVKLENIELFSREEKEEVLYRFNDTEAFYPQDKTILRLLENQVERTPGKVAAVGSWYGASTVGKEEINFPSLQLTYRELNQKSDQLARLLREKGILTDIVAGIMVQRSLEMIVGIWGILKAGGAYLPIDPGSPGERTNYMLKDSSAKVLLTSSPHWPQVKGESIEIIDISKAFTPSTLTSALSKVSPTDLAYVIYTSGSTGKPKGTMIAHHSLVNRLVWMQKKYPIDERDTILQKTPFTFDVSVWEMFWWGLAGARLCFLIPGGEKDPGVIVEAVEKYNVTIMHFVPSMLNAFLEHVKTEHEEKRLSGLTQVFSSGEALPFSLVKGFNEILHKTNYTRLVNLYGPTEATIDVSFFDCSVGGTFEIVPIGKPIDNIRLYVLNKHLRLQAVGIPGELFIAGVGLARGYLNNPELTNKKFLRGGPGGAVFSKSASPGRRRQKIYKTGDLAKWLSDGNIEFLGRLDHQVKIRGFRVEMGEIENRLLLHHEIKNAVVVSTDGSFSTAEKPGKPGKREKFLCAYIVSNKEPNVPQLRGYLAESLPDYMIPSSFIRIEEVPLTSNGKVDRKALDTIGMKLDIGVEYVAPENELEKMIAETWKMELNLDKIGIFDNFFDLGGNSLNIIQIRNKLKEQLKRNLPIAKLFSYPTIDSFTRYLQEEEGGDISSEDKIKESVDLMAETMQLLIGDDNE